MSRYTVQIVIIGVALVVGAILGFGSLLSNILHFSGLTMAQTFVVSVVWGVISVAFYVVAAQIKNDRFKLVGDIFIWLWLYAAIQWFLNSNTLWVAYRLEFAPWATALALVVAPTLVIASMGAMLKIVLKKPPEIIMSIVILSGLIGAIMAYQGSRTAGFRDPFSRDVVVGICPSHAEVRLDNGDTMTDDAHPVSLFAVGKGCVFHAGVHPDSIIEYDVENVGHRLLLESWETHGLRVGMNPAAFIEAQKNGDDSSITLEGATKTLIEQATGTSATGGSSTSTTSPTRGQTGNSGWAIPWLWIAGGAIAGVLFAGVRREWGDIPMMTIVGGILGAFAALVIGFFMTQSPVHHFVSTASYPQVVTLGIGQTHVVGKVDLLTADEMGKPLYVGVCGNSEMPNAKVRLSISENGEQWQKVVRRDLGGQRVAVLTGAPAKMKPVEWLATGQATKLVHNSSRQWIGETRVELRLTESDGGGTTLVIGPASELIGACETVQQPSARSAKLDMALRCAAGAIPTPGATMADCATFW